MSKPATDAQVMEIKQWAEIFCRSDSADTAIDAYRMLALIARIKLADALEKAAEAVIVNQQHVQGDVAGVAGHSVVDNDFITDLDTARDAYREAKGDE